MPQAVNYWLNPLAIPTLVTALAILGLGFAVLLRRLAFIGVGGADGEGRPQVDERVVAARVHVQAAGPRDVAEHPHLGGLLPVQHGRPREAVHQHRGVQGDADQLRHLGRDGADHVDVRQRAQPRATDADAAPQQPVASDLRRLIATMHVAGELERIGDSATNIAEEVRVA